ncbi:hypothetical protein QQG55_51855 [Brugia pahangi]
MHELNFTVLTIEFENYVIICCQVLKCISVTHHSVPCLSNVFSFERLWRRDVNFLSMRQYNCDSKELVDLSLSSLLWINA